MVRLNIERSFRAKMEAPARRASYDGYELASLTPYWEMNKEVADW